MEVWNILNVRSSIAPYYFKLKRAKNTPFTDANDLIYNRHVHSICAEYLCRPGKILLASNDG